MTAQEKINTIDLSKEIEERQFNELVILFRNDFLESREYESKRIKHRNPKAFLNEMLQESFDRLGELGRREHMRDIEIKDGKTIQGYVYSRVKWMVEADRSLNLYKAIRQYCSFTGKDFNSIALLMAEYRGLEKVRGRIRVDSKKIDDRSKAKSTGTAQFTNSNDTFSGDAISLLALRSEILSKLPFSELLSLQEKVSKVMSRHDFVLQASQKYQSLFYGTDALAKMISAQNQMSRTIYGTGMISRMFDLRPVLPAKSERYFGILDLLANNSLSEDFAALENNKSLLEVEYDFMQIAEESTENEMGSERSIILLNESRNIRQVILDIYKNHHRLLEVSPRQFEELIAELLSNQGFKVELTKQTRDGGYDIIAICDFGNQSPQKWLVECKRLKRQKIGIEIIRSFKEVVQANNVNRGIIATTSYFSADALKKQQETPYLLDFRDKDAVMNWIIDYGNQKR